MLRTCTTQLLQSLVMNYYPTFQQHVRIKRIQEARFLEDKAKANVGITQIDFAMAYSCEYQNEIQSALWTRATTNLFTLARFVNQEVTCYLFVLDNYKKDKSLLAYRSSMAIPKHFQRNISTAMVLTVNSKINT